jgi:hypothetical protein
MKNKTEFKEITDALERLSSSQGCLIAKQASPGMRSFTPKEGYIATYRDRPFESINLYSNGEGLIISVLNDSDPLIEDSLTSANLRHLRIFFDINTQITPKKTKKKRK